MKETILNIFLADLLFILVFVGFVSSVLVMVLSATYPFTGVSAGFSEGFSMCPAENSGLDYLPLLDSKCAYAPGDILITYHKWPPDVNSIACADLPAYGVVCHMVDRVSGGKACFVGTNPRAIPETCFTERQYVGEVVAKLPRAVGVPGMAFTVVRLAVQDFLNKVNLGGYPSGRVS